MNSVITKFSVMILCFGVLSCTSHSARLPIGSLYNPTNPEVIVVSDDVSFELYEVVGKVHSHCRWNWFFSWAACSEKTMIDNLKYEAAYLGANALIKVEHTSFSQFEWTDVHYHATAIRK